MAPPADKWGKFPALSREEASDSEDEVRGVAPRVAPKKKWDDEADDDEVLDSWDAADDSEEERKKEDAKKKAAEKAAAEAAANHKPKAERIAEKQAEKQAAAERAEREREALEGETPAERRERERQRQIESDLKHAEDLFGTVGIGAGGGIGGREKRITTVDPSDPSKNIDLATLPVFKPSTKQGFTDLNEILVPLLTANTKKAHYPIFLQEFVRQLSKDMPSDQIRKVASGLTTLANEKQKEEKAAEKGGKKTKAVKKTILAASGKEMDKFDTTNYQEAGYDFDDDFM